MLARELAVDPLRNGRRSWTGGFWVVLLSVKKEDLAGDCGWGERTLSPGFWTGDDILSLRQDAIAEAWGGAIRTSHENTRIKPDLSRLGAEIQR